MACAPSEVRLDYAAKSMLEGHVAATGSNGIKCGYLTGGLLASVDSVQKSDEQDGRREHRVLHIATVSPSTPAALSRCAFAAGGQLPQDAVGCYFYAASGTPYAGADGAAALLRSDTIWPIVTRLRDLFAHQLHADAIFAVTLEQEASEQQPIHKICTTLLKVALVNGEHAVVPLSVPCRRTAIHHTDPVGLYVRPVDYCAGALARCDVSPHARRIDQESVKLAEETRDHAMTQWDHVVELAEGEQPPAPVAHYGRADSAVDAMSMSTVNVEYSGGTPSQTVDLEWAARDAPPVFEGSARGGPPFQSRTAPLLAQQPPGGGSYATGDGDRSAQWQHTTAHSVAGEHRPPPAGLLPPVEPAPSDTAAAPDRVYGALQCVRNNIPTMKVCKEKLGKAASNEDDTRLLHAISRGGPNAPDFDGSSDSFVVVLDEQDGMVRGHPFVLAAEYVLDKLRAGAGAGAADVRCDYTLYWSVGRETVELSAAILCYMLQAYARDIGEGKRTMPALDAEPLAPPPGIERVPPSRDSAAPLPPGAHAYQSYAAPEPQAAHGGYVPQAQPTPPQHWPPPQPQFRVTTGSPAPVAGAIPQQQQQHGRYAQAGTGRGGPVYTAASGAQQQQHYRHEGNAHGGGGPPAPPTYAAR